MARTHDTKRGSLLIDERDKHVVVVPVDQGTQKMLCRLRVGQRLRLSLRSALHARTDLALAILHELLLLLHLSL